MKKGLLSGIIAVLLGATLAGCTNFFHDLIPPDGDRILSFTVEGQIGPAVINENSILVEMELGADRSALIPTIAISPRATLIPITLEYIEAAFPSADLKEMAMGLYTAYDLEAYVIDMIKLHKDDFTIPAINIPIDFSGPVDFFVVAGIGNMRRYTVSLEIDSNDPAITGFAFSKYDNPELIQDSVAVINEAARTITMEALYPMEMVLSYELIPSFEIRGDKAELNGAVIHSRETVLKFNPVLNVPQTRTVTVTRGNNQKEYTLSIVFKEDPDSARSITDFRFNKMSNSSIAATAVASILNNENYGSITVQVFYAGAKPSLLVPHFLSPGTVSVSGITQESGISSQDFSQALEYRVVSRNNKFVRTYTVRVELIDISAASPVITSFRFSCGVNHELVQDTTASISDSSGIILITASYGGTYAPSFLIPEFHATGIVTVRDAVQISDLSTQDFSVQVKYTVTDPFNSLLFRDYWVKVTFTRDASSDTKITSFSFHPDENPALIDELVTRIDQNAGTITVYAPVGSGVTSGVMTPRFTAVGHVEADGVIQASGLSGRMFDVPVVYTSVSANGVNRKNYTVTVRELQSTIFVKHDAVGLSDGTSWQNAFRDLADACDAAEQFPPDVLKEIWIAAGTYVPDAHFAIVSNTIYLGGFEGNETAKSQRNIMANTVTISGNGATSGAYLFLGNKELTGDIVFENLNITKHAGSAIYATTDDSAQIRITDCDFSELAGAVYIKGGNTDIQNTAFSAFASSANAIVHLDCPGETTITNVTVEDSPLGAFNLTGNGNKTLEYITIKHSGSNTAPGVVTVEASGGDVVINTMELSDITGTGIAFTGATGRKQLSLIAARTVSGSAVTGSGTGIFTLEDSSFDASGSITVSGSSAAVTVQRTRITNSNAASAVNITTSSTVTLNTVTIDRVSNGRGIYISSGGMARILSSVIKNCTTTQNGIGVLLAGAGTAEISGTTIESCVGSANANAVYNTQNGSFTVDDLKLQSITGRGIYKSGGGASLSRIQASSISGDAVYGENISSGSVSITNSEFNNTGRVYANVSVSTQVTNTDILNTTGNNALWITAGSAAVAIEGVTIDKVIGRGIYAKSNGTIRITDSNISNCDFTGGTFRAAPTFVFDWDYASKLDPDRANELYTAARAEWQRERDAWQAEYDQWEEETGGIYGGGIYLLGSGSASITNVKVGTITKGGGVYSTKGGGLTVNGLELQNITGRGIYQLAGGANFTSITANTIKDADAVYVNAGSAAITINYPTINGVPNGRGIYASSNTSIRISNGNIKNITAATSGAGIFLDGTGDKTVSGMEIRDVEVTGSSYGGGGIYNSGTSGNFTVSSTTIERAGAYNGGGIYSAGGSFSISGNSIIRNCKARSSGGGIYLSGAGNHSISATTIENVEANNGGGIYNAGPPRDSVSISTLTITGTTIKNAVAKATVTENYTFDGHGGGLYHVHTGRDADGTNRGNNKLIIGGNSQFENCRAENESGAVYAPQPLEYPPDGAYYNSFPPMHELTNTVFLNCNARNGQLILNAASFAFIRGCTFTHDDNLVSLGAPTEDYASSIFGAGGATFEDCTFNDLKGNNEGHNNNFLFNKRTYYSDGNVRIVLEQGTYTLRNNTFYLARGVGIAHLWTGSLAKGGHSVDRLLLDNNRI